MSRIVWPDAVAQAGQTFDLVARYARIWTCSVHDTPLPEEYDEDGHEVDFDWPVYGCTCRTTATWETNYDEIVFVLEGTLSKLIRAYYEPAITEMLNNGILLQKLTE